MKNIFLLLLFGFESALYISAQNSDARHLLSQSVDNFFIENKGQWPADVLFLTKIRGLNAWITNKGVLYDFYIFEEDSGLIENLESAIPQKIRLEKYSKSGHKVWFKLHVNNRKISWKGKGKCKAYFNYFIGNEENKNASNVGLYKEVQIIDVYNGIDMRYYFDQGDLRFDYIIHPGADPAQIRFSISGSDLSYVNQEGSLVFKTQLGDVEFTDLNSYQLANDIQVSSFFEQKEMLWSINIGSYDTKEILIIDPLVYSTYLGGAGSDQGTCVVADAFGNAYVTGLTESVNYDTTSGAYKTIYSGNWDVFISKFNDMGTSLVYSTYLGGSGGEWGNSLAVDNFGNVYVTGRTNSTDFKTTLGAYQTTYGGGAYDVFVSKLNSSGSKLVYSTYLGGNGYEEGSSIEFDATGNAYVLGFTNSINYDTTIGAYQTVYAGGLNDIFVTKLNSAGSSLVYSTYLGGSSRELGYSIAIDANGDSYITGFTESTDYNITSGAIKSSLGGSSDIVVSKLNNTGTALVYSTYLGGTGSDFGTSIDLDNSGNIYIAGHTSSIDFPITHGAYQTVHSGYNDIFVTKLDSKGDSLVYSTFLGGNGDEFSPEIMVDSTGNVSLTGYTNSMNFDTTLGAYQTNLAGNHDVFISKLNGAGNDLLYSTYLGGKNDDFGTSIASDGSENVIVTGSTKSNDFDTTSGAYHTSYSGSQDVFLTKLCLGLNATITLSSAIGSEAQSVCINDSIAEIKYATMGAIGANVSGLPFGVTSSWSANFLLISGAPIVSGTYHYTVKPLGCGKAEVYGSISVGCDGVLDGFKNNSLDIFPNPANQYVRIGGEFESPYCIEIIDALGVVKQFYCPLTSNQINISVAGFSNGVYWIRVVTSNQVFISNFIVRH